MWMRSEINSTVHTNYQQHTIFTKTQHYHPCSPSRYVFCCCCCYVYVYIYRAEDKFVAWEYALRTHGVGFTEWQGGNLQLGILYRGGVNPPQWSPRETSFHRLNITLWFVIVYFTFPRVVIKDSLLILFSFCGLIYYFLVYYFYIVFTFILAYLFLLVLMSVN